MTATTPAPASAAAAAAAPARDNLLGVCAAIGEDLGFNPDWLRVALAASLLWNWTAVLGIYAALGLVVLASRLLFPKPRRTATVVAMPAPAAEETFAYAQAA